LQNRICFAKVDGKCRITAVFGHGGSDMQQDSSRVWFFFSPTGRLSRGPYALGILFWFSLQFASIGQLFAGERLNSDPVLILGFLALVLTALLSVVSMVMLTIKRVHDIGHPGLLAFLIFIPVISFLALVFFLVFPSGPPNQYGSHPNQQP
jgi:uncharacterized membrane protein YhaH (DUF805 family)